MSKSSPSTWHQRLRSLVERRKVPVFYDPAYRLPLVSLSAVSGMETRRADYVAWYLIANRIIEPTDLRAPSRIAYSDLALVHSPDLLQSLGKRETLASIFAVDGAEVPVDETLRAVRLACGGTLDAARLALLAQSPVMNLLGGFHHAAPDKAGGMCPVNDIAVAVAVLRHEGLDGLVAIIDLDAHPPDGTAQCLARMPETWIGSLSASDWGLLPGVDETLLDENSGDPPYLQALSRLLDRLPRRPAIAFVIAGNDVLAGDRFGKLGLSLDGARRRDLKAAAALEGVPSVWLPGGGYHPDAWKVLAGTALALTRGSKKQIPLAYDPLAVRFAQVWNGLGAQLKPDQLELDADEVARSLRLSPTTNLLLGHYSAENIEFALYHCGILTHLQRLGFGHFKIEIDEVSPGDRMRLRAESEGKQYLLLECVLERKKVRGVDALYVHWLTLRNPKSAFSGQRPQLPGQELPGLGLARELGEVITRVARELKLQAVVFRPAWYHMAYAARHHFRFLNARRQGRFEAMLRDLGRLGLREATLAFAKGRIRLNGQPYEWEADEMISWLANHPTKNDRPSIEAEMSSVRFSLG